MVYSMNCEHGDGVVLNAMDLKWMRLFVKEEDSIAPVSFGSSVEPKVCASVVRIGGVLILAGKGC